jgi:hypothetical protein
MTKEIYGLHKMYNILREWLNENSTEEYRDEKIGGKGKKWRTCKKAQLNGERNEDNNPSKGI